tara:strand:- start:5601 stop:6872 length:1272 start_codon:yes stop_codon:yes gene_type:complete
MSQTRKTLADTNKSIGGFGGKLKGMAIPLAIAAAGFVAVKKAISQVSDAMNRLDREAKAAESLGLQIQELQSLTFSAQLAGLEGEQFITIFSKLQKKIGEAAIGTGEAAATFEKLGLSTDNLLKMSPDERFLAIADAIKKIENPALQAAMATKLFEEEGLKLLPMLQSGSEGIQSQREELERLQGTLSKHDTDKIQDANNAWTKLKTAAEGLWNQLAVALAPIFELIANILTEIVVWAVKAVNAFNKWINTITFGAVAYKEWTLETNKAKKASEEAMIQAEKQREAEEKAAKAREALEQRGIKLAESLRTPIEKYTDTIKDLDMMLSEGVISWETYERAVKKANDELEKSEEFKKKEIKAIERQAIGIATRGSTAALSAQQKQVRIMERIAEQNKLELEESRKRNHKLDAIKKNTGSVNVVRI